MNDIRKAGNNIYFKSYFKLRSKDENWANPIEFPAIFIAYGKAIKSGRWQKVTSINTPKYVIDNYFKGNKYAIAAFDDIQNIKFWNLVEKLSKLDNKKVYSNMAAVQGVIDEANKLLRILPLVKE